MRITKLAVAGLVLLWLSWGYGHLEVLAQVESNDANIAVMDTCLPGDPGWDPTGGCALNPHQGDVSAAEFFQLLVSPLTIPPNAALVGHPSWRNEPSHVVVKEGRWLRAKNLGGRSHTFTEVANFGGGFVPVLNVGLTPAPECSPTAVLPLPPGEAQVIGDLAPGLHKFQCCIHPWMRATVRVD